MTKATPGRAWPTLDAALFAAGLVVYALGLPLGLARVEAAPQVAAGIAFDTSSEPAVWGLFALRIAGYIPIGDYPLRANLASAGLSALALALLGRLCIDILVLLRPAAKARQEARDFLQEPIAAAAAALAAALSLSAYDVATTGGSAAATMLLLAAGLLVGLGLVRDCTMAASGWALAGLAGFSAGVDAAAGWLLWPLLVGLGIWGLRKGARWPLLAPLAFVAAWGGSVLATVARSSAPLALGGVLARHGGLPTRGGPGLWATAVELGDQIGVVGALLAVVGLVVVAMRASLVGAWLALTLLSAMLFGHAAAPVGAGPWRAALPLAVAASCVFAAAGLLHVASRLGRARLAATAALSVMLVLTPAMDGRRGSLGRRPALAVHLLARALDRAELGSVVDPGTPEMDGLFRLARAMAWRPDLVIGKAADKSR
ncbi:MAG: hypothetical protein JXP73_16495 [Deltaproteobacteria bacterium]|nr:hypothetical protein [Deltaproteobacteria bacterium]